MALPAVGSEITMVDIATEFGGVIPHALSEYYGDGNAPASGEIQMSADFGGTSAGPVASGGTETTFVSGGNTYRIHAFTSSGTFTVTQGGVMDVMLVAGGAGGGNPGPYGSSFTGGGGAGGLILDTNKTVGTGSFSIVIGNGGGAYANGGNTTGFSLTAIGGGTGGDQRSNFQNGLSGGSGGGGASSFGLGGAGTSGQGNAGGKGTNPSTSPSTNGSGGGGGGAGAAGGVYPPHGGAGRDMSSYFGTTYGESGWFAGGGGGIIHSGGTAPVGGQGGGGDGAPVYSAVQTAGTANTGGGGGAGSQTVTLAGKPGGSGIVLIRYLT